MNLEESSSFVVNYVHHNKWFYYKLKDVEYKCKYINSGFNYSAFKVKTKNYYFKSKYLKLYYWKTIIANSDRMNIPVIKRKKSYLVNNTKERLDELIFTYLEKNKDKLEIKTKHTKNI